MYSTADTCIYSMCTSFIGHSRVWSKVKGVLRRSVYVRSRAGSYDSNLVRVLRRLRVKTGEGVRRLRTPDMYKEVELSGLKEYIVMMSICACGMV